MPEEKSGGAKRSEIYAAEGKMRGFFALKAPRQTISGAGSDL